MCVFGFLPRAALQDFILEFVRSSQVASRCIAFSAGQPLVEITREDAVNALEYSGQEDKYVTGEREREIKRDATSVALTSNHIL